MVSHLQTESMACFNSLSNGGRERAVAPAPQAVSGALWCRFFLLPFPTRVYCLQIMCHFKVFTGLGFYIFKFCIVMMNCFSALRLYNIPLS